MSAQDLDTLRTELLEEIRRAAAKAVRRAVVLVPAGIVSPFAGSTAPVGYLICDGSAISRTDYPDLFSVIGETYGAGDGSTTFNLPDATGRVIAGLESTSTRLTAAGSGISGETLGAAGGTETKSAAGTIGGSQSIAHRHNIAHVHQWMHYAGASDFKSPYTLTSVNDAVTGITTGSTKFAGASAFDNAGGGTVWSFTNASDLNFYTTGPLSSPVGSGSDARSDEMTANETVSGSNFSFTGSATSTTQPTLVLNYIIKT